MATTTVDDNGRDTSTRMPLVTLLVMLVTPDMARGWLATQANNRRVTPGRVSQFARDILAGNWMLNGETIVFDENGRLLDGQHRLHAVIEAGIPVRMAVARNVPAAAMATLDQGRPRGLGDVLQIDSQKNANLLAAIVRWVYKYEHTAMQSQGPISHSELLVTLERHPKILDSVQMMTSLPRIGAPAPIGFVHYWGARTTSAAKADEFAHSLAHGSDMGGNGLPAGHPIFLLRERLLRERLGKSKLPAIEVCALSIIAWKYFIADRRLRHLRWRAKGPAAQPFPTFDS